MTSQIVPFLDVGATYSELSSEIDAAIGRVLRSGWYLLGEELEHFEDEWASFSGSRFCAGVGSGLDALILGLRALGVGQGDEVIVPSNTYIATWMAVSAVGAMIVPVEPDERSFNITPDAVRAAITPRTSAILPVHLYGQPVDAIGIEEVAASAGIPTIYDAAQAHGARIRGEPVGAFGSVVAWSFYPGKNLGAFADAGAVTSDSPEIVERVRVLRNYGSQTKYFNDELGVNSRMDEVSASVLRVKLKTLEGWNLRRREIAEKYGQLLEGSELELPQVDEGFDSAWHLYVARSAKRDLLRTHLEENGIGTVIHYPVPPHRQRAYLHMAHLPLPIAEKLAAEVLSLPIGPHLNPSQIDFVCDVIHQFA